MKHTSCHKRDMYTNLDRRSSFEHSPPRRSPPPCASHLPAGVDSTMTTMKMSRSTMVVMTTMTTITRPRHYEESDLVLSSREPAHEGDLSLVARKSGSSANPPPRARGTIAVARSFPLSLSRLLSSFILFFLCRSLSLSLSLSCYHRTTHGKWQLYCTWLHTQCLPTRALTRTTDRAPVEIIT